MSADLSFARLHVGLDLTSQQVEQFLTRLMAPGAPRPLVFETWADDAGVRHFIGRSESKRRALTQLLAAYLPEATLQRESRPTSELSVARVVSRSRRLPIGRDTSSALYAFWAALSTRQKGEVIALQVVLGRGHGPVHVPRDVLDPTQSPVNALLRGHRRAGTEVRRELVSHHSQSRVDVTVRLAFSAPVRPREKTLRSAVTGALRAIESPGVRLEVRAECLSRWLVATASLAPLSATAASLWPLLVWPVDHLPLTGLPPQHPRQLPPPGGLPKDEAVFAHATMPGRERPIGISAEDRSQHLVVTGGTGSGKSTIFARLCLEDIAAGRATLLVDPKRQLVDHIIDRVPPGAIDRIVLIDAADPEPVGLNPLDIGDRDADVVVDGILSVFKAVFEDGWGPRTEDLLHSGLLTLARSGAARSRPHTLLDLPRLLSDVAYRRGIVGAVADDPTLASFWAVFDGLSPAHRAAVTAPPMNKLRKYLLRRNVAAVLGQEQPKFRMRDLFRDQKTVLVPLNDALLGPGSAQLLGGLVVAEAWLATMERASEANPMDRPGMIFIDEVQRFLHLPTSIEDALATSRSYGVAWHLALQGRSQVPNSLALALELNARNKITFAASPNDAAALARSTRLLVAEDFQSLGKYEVYADLVVAGAPAGWFLARTLPPLPALGSADAVRAATERLAGTRGALHEQAPAQQPEGAAPRPVGHQKRRRT